MALFKKYILLASLSCYFLALPGQTAALISPVMDTNLTLGYQNFAYMDHFIPTDITAQGRVSLSFISALSLRPSELALIDTDYNFNMVTINRSNSGDQATRSNHSASLNVYYVWNMVPQYLEGAIGIGGWLSGFMTRTTAGKNPDVRNPDLLDQNLLYLATGLRSRFAYRPILGVPFILGLELGYSPLIGTSGLQNQTFQPVSMWNGAFSLRYDLNRFILHTRYFLRYQNGEQFNSLQHGIQISGGYRF